MAKNKASVASKALMTRSSKSVKSSKSHNPEPFADSFTTNDATFAVEVKVPWGDVSEDIEVQIDCGGTIHGDEGTIDVLIEMLEKARDNLLARKGRAATDRYWAKGTGR